MHTHMLYSTHTYTHSLIPTQTNTEVWLGQDDDLIPSTDGVTTQQSYSHQQLVVALVRFLFLWQAIFRVSNVGTGVMLAFIVTFVSLLGRTLILPLNHLKSLPVIY